MSGAIDAVYPDSGGLAAGHPSKRRRQMSKESINDIGSVHILPLCLVLVKR